MAFERALGGQCDMNSTGWVGGEQEGQTKDETWISNLAPGEEVTILFFGLGNMRGGHDCMG